MSRRLNLLVYLSLVLGACDTKNQEQAKSFTTPTETSKQGIETSRNSSGRNIAPVPTINRPIPWANSGTWLRVDTHTHTKFSDGGNSVEQIVAKALEFDCYLIAITDHSDQNLTAATPEYREAILAAREAHPELIILAGLEWNVPPYGGQEHASVIVPITPDEWDVLAGFKTRFDDYRRGEQPAALADEALRWLQGQYADSQSQPIVILNHPARKRESTETVISDVIRWRSAADILIGMSGAPGHQRDSDNGAYEQTLKTMDRWDPVAAEIGGAWDQLLQSNHDVWAARAPSDIHNAGKPNSKDYWPGQFSETWVYAREKSAAAVIDALHAGSFFAVHGHIAREVQLLVDTDGLERAAIAGETIEARQGATIEVSLEMMVPSTDWQGNANHLDEIEFIGITANGAESLVRQAATSDRFVHSMTVPDGGLVLRARGRRVIEGGDDYLFYTNPIRINVH